MKKILFVLAIATLLTAGCTAKTAPTSVNEKTAPGSAASNNDQAATQRINDIKNGATPKVKPTGETAENVPPVPVEKSVQTDLKINEDTKNMNKATIKTSKGDIVIELDTVNAPISAENFKKYATSGYYSKTLFHRVMPGFMVQGGGFDESREQKETEAPIKNEATNGLKNDRGTLAMARTMVVDSATSQFFINLVDNDFLNYQNEANYGYAVFAKVIEGMEVVDEIAKVATGNNGPHQNWPTEDVIIESVVLSE
jgi:peptidyl-prolyl cis-trans isomerase B (cyclophilin B)